jgi:hypothetical protein
MEKNQQNVTDEREGLPSASTIERLAACPGSLRMSRGIPEYSTPQMREWADSGERIHLWLEAPDFVPLEDPDELAVAERCAHQRDEHVRQVFEEVEPIIFKENRLWLHHPDGRKRFSGRLDFTAIFKDVALVDDYKTNRGDIAEASTNLQLRAHAVLTWLESERKLKTIYAGKVQPLVDSHPELCKYGTAELEASLAELIGILVEAEKPDAPLKAGHQCKFCPAKLVCPSARKMLEEVSQVEPAMIKAADGKELSRLLDLFAACGPIIETGQAFAKELLKVNPNAIPSWSLKANAPLHPIRDPQVAWGRAAEDGMPMEQFMTCVTVGKGDMEDMLKRVHKRRLFTDKNNRLPTIEELKDFRFPKGYWAPIWESFLDGNTDTKPKEPSLERTK